MAKMAKMVWVEKFCERSFPPALPLPEGPIELFAIRKFQPWESPPAPDQSLLAELARVRGAIELVEVLGFRQQPCRPHTPDEPESE